MCVQSGTMDPAASGIPRPEYPRPHLVRPQWMNLNGPWQFAFDDADRGLAEGWHTGRELPLRIVVPFCVEAPLSGIADRSIHPVIWYRRTFELPDAFLRQQLLLHIGACDFATQIWVNGRSAGTHRGGYTPITCAIRHLVHRGANELVIRVEDQPVWTQPRGKQIVGERPEWIDYDRVTGIWQTVWLEPVPATSITDVWTEFHLDDGRLTVHVTTDRACTADVHVQVAFAGAEVAQAGGALRGTCETRLTLAIPQARLWSPDDPALYDLTVTLRCDGEETETVRTYAGLREFRCEGRSLLLNGAPFYFRGVLDQGYFPGGWYTAGSDADLKRDVELIQALGFNGVRKHQKLEDPRWLAWADRLGLVVWSEIGSGRTFGAALMEDFTDEWMAAVRRDRMHPSIMAWVPLNESWGIDAVAHSEAQRQWVRALYHLTQALDGSRPVIANDGWQFVIGDLWGIHNYVPDAPFLAETLQRIAAQPTTEIVPGRSAALPGVDVGGIPMLLTEFGGIACGDPRVGQEAPDAWAYATAADPTDFGRRIGDLVTAIRSLPQFSGFVWTQLTDVQQERNGLLCFDRTPKLSLDTYRRLFGDGE